MYEEIDLAFCILQYGAKRETIECIRSIERFCGNQVIRIVIVDNASPDDAYSYVAKEFTNDPIVEVIKNKNNIGFARGNNIGIAHIRQKYRFKYLIVCNNDTLLLEPHVFETIDAEFQRSSFSVLGPQIFTIDGRFVSNPVREKIYSISDVKGRIIREKRLLFISKVDVVGLLGFARKFRNTFLKKKLFEANPSLYLTKRTDVQLHGSFLVFSNIFFDKMDGFDESTFMYMEEYFLAKHCMEKGLKVVYSPELRVFHKEDASTDEAIKSNRKKEIFIRTHSLDSAKKLLELYRRYEEQSL